MYILIHINPALYVLQAAKITAIQYICYLSSTFPAIFIVAPSRSYALRHQTSYGTKSLYGVRSLFVRQGFSCNVE